METTDSNSKAEGRLFLFIIAFTVFSGAMRKWVFESNFISNITLGILLILPILFFGINYRNSLRVVRPIALVSYLLLLAVQAFNPMNLTIYHGILGMVMHGGIWCMMFAYLNNRVNFDFLRLIPVFIAISVGEIVLGAIQYQLPHTHFLNKYVREVSSIANVGDAIRVSGTFAYLGGFQTYIIFHLFVVWGLLRLKYKPLVSIGMLFLGLFGALMSGSRTTVYSYLLITTFILIFERKGINVSKLVVRLVIPAALFVLVILSNSFGDVTKLVVRSFDNFNDRRTLLVNRGEERKRIFSDYNQLVDFRGAYPITGVGLGSTYQGATQLFGTSKYVQDYGYYETELARIVLEGGFILLFVRFALIAYFVSRCNFPTKTKWFLTVYSIFLGASVFNIYQSIFYVSGLMFLDNINTHIQKGELENQVSDTKENNSIQSIQTA